jgi:hypothetical protein
MPSLAVNNTDKGSVRYQWHSQAARDQAAVPNEKYSPKTRQTDDSCEIEGLPKKIKIITSSVGNNAIW